MRKLILFFYLLLYWNQAVLSQDISGYEIVIGNKDAPITITEYTSLTCNHCADFHLYVLPQIKDKYIKTGQVKFVLKPFAMDPMSLSAYKLINSLPAENREMAMLKVFSMQSFWLNKKPEELGKILGLTDEEIKSALNNTEVENTLISTAFWAQKQFNVTATPTFIYGTEMVEGAPSFTEFSAKIEQMQQQ